MTKKEKQQAIVTLLVTGITLGSFCFTAWFHTPNQVSISERRRLAQLPEFTADSILDGTFMSRFERYSQDQFPFRDTFRRFKSEALFSVYQQKDVHGIYMADGYAATIEDEINEASVAHALSAFENVYNLYLKDGHHAIYAAIVPDKGYYLAEKNGYPSMDYESFFQKFEDGMPYASFIDLTPTLSLESFYRTDSHWRQEALLDTAQVIQTAMAAGEAGEKDTTEDAYASSVSSNTNENKISENKTNKSKNDISIHQATDSFYGVYYGQAELPMSPDTISYVDSEIISQAQVYNFETGKTSGVYDWDKLDGYDAYDFFLSGPAALLTIENPNASSSALSNASNNAPSNMPSNILSNAPSAKEDCDLIVFRDSYGSSLIPLLIDKYSKIIVIDIRYVVPEMLGEFIDLSSDAVDRADVLFLYGTILLNDSSTLKK